MVCCTAVPATPGSRKLSDNKKMRWIAAYLAGVV